LRGLRWESIFWIRKLRLFELCAEFARAERQHHSHELSLQRRILRTKRRGVFGLQCREVQLGGRKFCVHFVCSRLLFRDDGSDGVFGVRDAERGFGH
jgi:hypothetical protein